MPKKLRQKNGGLTFDFKFITTVRFQNWKTFQNRKIDFLRKKFSLIKMKEIKKQRENLV